MIVYILYVYQRVYMMIMALLMDQRRLGGPWGWLLAKEASGSSVAQVAGKLKPGPVSVAVSVAVSTDGFMDVYPLVI